jgi:hypothetical protein
MKGVSQAYASTTATTAMAPAHNKYQSTCGSHAAMQVCSWRVHYSYTTMQTATLYQTVLCPGMCVVFIL